MRGDDAFDEGDGAGEVGGTVGAGLDGGFRDTAASAGDEFGVCGRLSVDNWK